MGFQFWFLLFCLFLLTVITLIKKCACVYVCVGQRETIKDEVQ